MLQATAPVIERENDARSDESMMTNDGQIDERNSEVVVASTTEVQACDAYPWRFQSSIAFACLYTKHKTQKRKIWHDGRLLLQSCQAVLYDANPAPGAEASPLGECELSASQRNAILQKHETRLEFELFLVEIQGLWNTESNKSPISSSLAPARSKGMEKVLTKRFQKPGAFVPPDPSHQPHHPQHVQNSSLGKRRRPLQPGELQQRYYGNRANTPAVVTMAWNQQIAPQSLHSAHAVSQSQRRTPFVPSNQMQDTEQWTSPRRPVNSPSTNSVPRATVTNERSMMVPSEQRTIHSQQMTHRDEQRHSRITDSRCPPSADLNGIDEPVASNQQRRHNQFRDKNGFDPNSFFGEEEEDETEEEEDNINEIRFNKDIPWFRAKPIAKEKQGNSWDEEAPVVNNVSKPQPNHPTIESSHIEEGRSVLSRSELLQLFATGSPTNTNQETAGTGPAEKPGEQTSFELILPSASESSSDDESAEEGQG